MAQEDVAVRLRLLQALKFKRDAEASSKALRGVGTTADHSARALGVMEAASSRTNKVLAAGLGVAKRYSLLGLGAVGFSLHEVVHRAQEAETTMRRTNAVIASTHGVANVTADRVERLSSALGDYTDLNYETIHQGENMVLTFTKIRNEAGKGNNIFDRTVRTVTAMTQAFHGSRSITQTAVQVGKALQDPTRGVSALRRVGVNFTSDQQKMLEKLVKTGQTLRAQKYILRELNREFPLTAGTPWQHLITQFDRLQVILGKALIPYLDKGARSTAKLIDQFNHGVGEGGKIRETLDDTARSAGHVAKELTPLLHVVERFRKPLAAVAGGWLAISVGMGAVKKVSGPLGKLLGRGVATKVGRYLGTPGSTPKNPMYVVVLNNGGNGLPIPGKGEKGKGGFLSKAGKVLRYVPDVAALAAGAEAAITNKVPGWVPGLGGMKLTDNVISFGGGHGSPIGHPRHRDRNLGADRGSSARWLTPVERNLRGALDTGLTNVAAAAAAGSLANGGDIVIQFQPILDGRVIAESVHRHSVKAKALTK